LMIWVRGPVNHLAVQEDLHADGAVSRIRNHYQTLQFNW
jgi:hypothetical protein